MVSSASLALLARVEAAGIRASETAHQREVDGWLVGLAPSRAKRSRCVQAVAAGTRGLHEKIATCKAFYQAAGLPTVFRVTPFSSPHTLDNELAERGWRRFDETAVMVATSLDSVRPGETTNMSAEPTDVRSVMLGHAEFVRWTAAAQDWPPADAAELASRLGHARVPHENLALVDPHDRPVACGQMAVDGDVVGLFSILTSPAWRRRGLGRRLCRELIGRAVRHHATVAYLQVEATNETARRLYQSLGFVDAYRYHYRGEPDVTGAASVVATRRESAVAAERSSG